MYGYCNGKLKRSTALTGLQLMVNVPGNSWWLLWKKKNHSIHFVEVSKLNLMPKCEVLKRHRHRLQLRAAHAQPWRKEKHHWRVPLHKKQGYVNRPVRALGGQNTATAKAFFFLCSLEVGVANYRVCYCKCCTADKRELLVGNKKRAAVVSPKRKVHPRY